MSNVEFPDDLEKERAYTTYHTENGLGFLFNTLLFKISFDPHPIMYEVWREGEEMR